MPNKSLRVRPADRAAWRAWLEQHHATASEVTLEFARKGYRQPTVSYPDAVEEALCFGWIDGVKHKIDDFHYSHRFTPRKPGGNWSAINKQRIAALEAAGLMHASGIAVLDAAKRDGSWAREQVIKTDLPAELRAALAKSAKAKRHYQTLAPGQQISWHRWVGEAKQAATREQRAARAVGMLAAGAKMPMQPISAAARGTSPKRTRRAAGRRPSGPRAPRARR